MYEFAGINFSALITVESLFLKFAVMFVHLCSKGLDTSETVELDFVFFCRSTVKLKKDDGLCRFHSASSVNGNTSNKSMTKTRRCLVCQDLKGIDTPKNATFFACFSLKFYLLRR